MTDSSYMISPGSTNEDLAIKRKIALALMQQGADTAPVQHWTQGLARMAQGALGGYEAYSAAKEDKEETARGNAMLAGLFTGGAPQQPAAPAADMSEPRGLRNNNPLNIEAGGFTQSQPGFTGSDGRFAKFASLDQGVGAADKLLQTYATKHGLNTPAGIVGRWAPASDGNPVNNYASSVAKALGSAPDAPVDMANPDVRQKIIAAMAQFENGKPLPAAQPQQMAQAPGINRDAVVQMLGNRKTAPMAQGIIGQHIAQQFKPQDYDIHHRPDGSIIAVNKKNPQDVRAIQQPGASESIVKHEASKAGATKRAELEAAREVAKPDKDKQEQKVANIAVDEIDRAIKTIDSATLPTTGMVGGWLSNVGGTAARDVAGLLDTVKANAGFEELSKMRAASPTGGALGSITEKELALLQATIGNLEQSQSEPQLKDNLRRVKNAYLDIIHGPGNGPAREKLTFKEQPGDGWKDMGGGVRIREKR